MTSRFFSKEMILQIQMVIIMSLAFPFLIKAQDYNISDKAASNFVSTVIDKNVRITVLTPALLRLEWSEDGKFEDRPSFAFIHRNLEAPDFQSEVKNGELIINTSELELRYKTGSGMFTENNLSIRLKSEITPVTWKPGMQDAANLGGTVRTLDGVSGSTPLDPGLVSRDGWVLFDDSKNLLLDGNPPWPTPRENKELQDWYFFGYGHDYQRAIKDYTKLGGDIPLPPLYAFGAWWSRYWAYTDNELKEIVNGFEEHDLPLDVLVIDMDWHLDGWTGYTWNPKYFPNPDAFLEWCHNKGLKTTLNLHPHSGIKKHESQFENFARFMGKDPDNIEEIPFDIADPKYMEGYFKLVHNPMEKQGVDFWWIDWQQGAKSKIPGLDPLFWLNHLHWMDMTKNPDRGNKRPIIFSRWGGLGNHRYQIGFSGDTYCNWESLNFQPYFTSTAANVGYTFWSHDIGGHQPGPVDGELYVRWLQFAALNPVMRTHTTKNPASERRIWKFSNEVLENGREAYKLRYRLLPYIYTAARKAHDDAVPMLRPLYYIWPEKDEAYNNDGAYIFGDDIFVVPVTKPEGEFSKVARTETWLPPGKWCNWFTGELYEGDREIILETPLDQIPLFVKSGAVIPTYEYAHRINEQSMTHVILEVFPHEGKGRFETYLYEDDGLSTDYLNDGYANTKLEYGQLEANTTHFLIGPSKGEYRGKPEKRHYTINFRDQWLPEKVTVDGRDLEQISEDNRETRGWYYDQDNFQIVVELPEQVTNKEVYVVIYNNKSPLHIFKQGLRGDIHFVEKLVDKMGDSTPASIEEYLNTLKTVSPETVKGIQSLDQVIDSFVQDVATTLTDNSLKNDIICQLYGLSIENTLTRHSDTEYEVVFSVHVTNSRKELNIKVDYDLPRSWRKSGEKAEVIFDDYTGKIYKKRTTLECSETGIHEILKFDVKIYDDNIEIDVPYQVPVFPSIPRWQIIGPFEHKWADSMKVKYPPEIKLDTRKVYKGKNDKIITWKIVERADSLSFEEEFVVDFNKNFGFTENAVAYAAINVQSEIQQSAILKIGSDDGVKIWLNGKEIYFNHVARAYKSKENAVKVKLRKGENILLVKVSQWGGGWFMGAHLEGEDEKPLKNVTYKYIRK